MKEGFIVGVAGALGAISRFTMSEISSTMFHFPLGTLLVNLIGTFFLCFLTVGASSFLHAHPIVYRAITIGFLGAFTTFSAFSMETMQLVQREEWFIAIVYVTASLFAGLSAGIVGFRLSRKRVRG